MDKRLGEIPVRPGNTTGVALNIAAPLKKVAPGAHDRRGEHVFKGAVRLAPRLDQFLPIPPARPWLALAEP
jgi:hypothetical protein